MFQILLVEASFEVLSSGLTWFKLYGKFNKLFIIIIDTNLIILYLNIFAYNRIRINYLS